MSLPIHVSLLADGKLQLEPVKELKALRQEHYHFENLHITPEAGLPLDIQVVSLEIEIEFPTDLKTEAGCSCAPPSTDRTKPASSTSPSCNNLSFTVSNPGPM